MKNKKRISKKQKELNTAVFKKRACLIIASLIIENSLLKAKTKISEAPDPNEKKIDGYFRRENGKWKHYKYPEGDIIVDESEEKVYDQFGNLMHHRGIIVDAGNRPFYLHSHVPKKD